MEVVGGLLLVFVVCCELWVMFIGSGPSSRQHEHDYRQLRVGDAVCVRRGTLWSCTHLF